MSSFACNGLPGTNELVVHPRDRQHNRLRDSEFVIARGGKISEKMQVALGTDRGVQDMVPSGGEEEEGREAEKQATAQGSTPNADNENKRRWSML